MPKRRLDIDDDGICRRCQSKCVSSGVSSTGKRKWRKHKCAKEARNSGESAKDGAHNQEWLDDHELAVFFAGVVRDDELYIETRMKAARQAKDMSLVKSKVEDDQAKRMDPITIVPDSEVLSDGSS